MRHALTLVSTFALLTPACLLAGMEILCADAPVRAEAGGERPAKRYLPKADRATNRLLLPFFEVDTTDPAGSTTLFAVRNTSDAPVDLDLFYFTLGGVLQIPAASAELAPRETLTVNLRDVAGPFAVDSDGFSRGYVVIEEEEVIVRRPGARGAVINPPPEPARALVGDYFQVIPGEDFASGDRLLNLNVDDEAYFDLCASTESRFLNGGAFTGGSVFTVYSNLIGGLDGNAEATVVATVYDEAGGVHETCQIFTDQFSLRLPVSDLTAEPFGTVEFEFPEEEGQVLTEFNALGRFSVGMRGVCKDPAQPQ